MSPKIFVIGTGPGEMGQMTGTAHECLLLSEVIIGYDVYIKLIKPYFPDKEFKTTPMKKEVERCELAVKETLKGKKVALISGGDAGVYGMASIMLEIADKYELEVEVVPGVTAALSGSAVLGAPLSNDFAVISLSDLLTPWEVIEKRLKAAAEGDFVIAIYNPGSRSRKDYLKRACDILLQYQSPAVPAGLVRNISREGQTHRLTTLSKLAAEHVDMFTTVFVGNSQTIVLGDKMVTKRGYKSS